MQSCFTNLGQSDETFFSPVDDYSFTGGPSPQFFRINTGALAAGDIVDLEFQYTTRSPATIRSTPSPTRSMFSWTGWTRFRSPRRPWSVVRC